MLRRIRLPGLLSATSSSSSTAAAAASSSSSLLRRHALSSLAQGAAPSQTTTVLLRHLAPSATEAALKSAVGGIKDLDCRKVELEPGCAFHFANEAEATYASKILATALPRCSSNFANATMPSLLLQNLPPTMSAQRLEETFGKFNPKVVRMTGSATVQVVLPTADDALLFAHAVKQLTVGNVPLRAHIVKLSDESFAVQVSNFEGSAAVADVQTAVKDALNLLMPGKAATVTVDAGAPKSATVRFPPGTTDDALASLQQLTVDGKKLRVSAPAPLTKPALFVRNVKKVGATKLAKLVADTGAEHFQLNRQSADVFSDLAVAYYPNEASAMAALATLRATRVDGMRVAVSYREVSEPAVTIANLPANYSDADLADLLALYKPVRTQVTGTGAARKALVVLGGPHDAQLAVDALDGRAVDVGGKPHRLSVVATPVHDVGVHVSAEDGSALSAAGLAKALDGLRPKGVAVCTNVSAFLGFMTAEEAIAAQSSFIDGSTTLDKGGEAGAAAQGGGFVTSRISVQPTYVLEVGGLDQDTPVSDLLGYFANPDTAAAAGAKQDQQQQQKQGKQQQGQHKQKGGKDSAAKQQAKGGKDAAPAAAADAAADAAAPAEPKTEASPAAVADDVFVLRALRADRSAIVKFKRHSDVVPGLKQLRAAAASADQPVLHGALVEKYREVIPDGAHAIDEDGADEAFDEYALGSVMRDYMHADPATRYQIAQNYFERALVDAQATQNVDLVVDKHVSKDVREEAQKLIGARRLDQLSKQRLFELYIQREDLATFVHDFRELEAFFGPARPEDNFDWSQFRVEEWADIAKLQDAMKAADEKFMAKAAGASGHRAAAGDAEASATAGTTDEAAAGREAAKEIVLTDESGEGGATISLEDPAALKDKEGRLWSGAILDTDMVQKTMPGGRVGTHRALVVVGNLRGAAGFGMGKGKTGGDAVNAAFRDALRNLTYIDIYDRFGLAHDLHGKHNSCHAYIRATPRARVMVASPFATAVLTRFGIGSASVKLVGRRDPYAMVRALFNAIKQHENIDEFAKDRGKRYLTLKWLYDNNI